MKNNLEHIGDYDGYQVYRNADGCLEGYKKTGKKILKLPQGEVNLGTDCKRIITTARTMIDYMKQYERTKKVAIKPKPAELPKLFDPENL